LSACIDVWMVSAGMWVLAKGKTKEDLERGCT